MSLLYNHFTINEKGHLCIGGMDTVDLAKKYGTPLMALDEAYIEIHLPSTRKLWKSISVRILCHYLQAKHCVLKLYMKL